MSVDQTTEQNWRSAIAPGIAERYEAAGFGRPGGMGSRPALLIIDVQYRTVGDSPQPFYDSLADYPTSCGEVGWAAVSRIATLLESFRARGLPVLYPHVAPKQQWDAGRLGAKVPAIMDVPSRGYDFVADIAPREGEILVPKNHPSAFFGTSLISYLVDLGVDTVVITGCTTSGCVRSTAVDAFSHNYRVVVPHDGVYDRAPEVHAYNLFDLGQKYADITSCRDLTARLSVSAPEE